MKRHSLSLVTKFTCLLFAVLPLVGAKKQQDPFVHPFANPAHNPELPRFLSLGIQYPLLTHRLFEPFSRAMPKSTVQLPTANGQHLGIRKLRNGWGRRSGMLSTLILVYGTGMVGIKKKKPLPNPMPRICKEL